MPVKPSLFVNRSPLIALVTALPDFDQLAGSDWPVERFACGAVNCRLRNPRCIS